MKVTMAEAVAAGDGTLHGAIDYWQEEATRWKAEAIRLQKDAARYNWLINKVFCRGETCLVLYEEFGGAPLKGDTIRKFMDRYIDEAMPPNV